MSETQNKGAVVSLVALCTGLALFIGIAIGMSAGGPRLRCAACGAEVTKPIVWCEKCAWRMPCGHCGKPIVIQGCGENMKCPHCSESPLEKHPKAFLNVHGGRIQWEWNTEKSSPHLIGTVHNNAQADLENADLRWRIYDANDNILGEVSTLWQNVPAGETWKFDVGVYKDNAAYAELITFKDWRPPLGQ